MLTPGELRVEEESESRYFYQKNREWMMGKQIEIFPEVIYCLG